MISYVNLSTIFEWYLGNSLVRGSPLASSPITTLQSQTHLSANALSQFIMPPTQTTRTNHLGYDVGSSRKTPDGDEHVVQYLDHKVERSVWLPPFP